MEDDPYEQRHSDHRDGFRGFWTPRSERSKPNAVDALLIVIGCGIGLVALFAFFVWLFLGFGR